MALKIVLLLGLIAVAYGLSAAKLVKKTPFRGINVIPREAYADPDTDIGSLSDEAEIISEEANDDGSSLPIEANDDDNSVPLRLKRSPCRSVTFRTKSGKAFTVKKC